MNAGVHVELGRAGLAASRFEPICELYGEVFSKPPFDGGAEDLAHQRERLVRLMANPAFGITVAGAGGELVGFAYGAPLRPDTKWWDGFLVPVPEDVTKEWERRTFALIDMAVAGSWRRRGVGRRLLDVLLGSRSEQRATLAVRPTATGTQAFYRRLGWQYVGRLPGAPGEPSPFFDIYVVPLGDRP
jgi:ribosomal protein S18 acetylase RimI-like enzyme